MSQTTNNDQVPIFCLANAIDVIKPLLIKYAGDVLPNITPKVITSTPSPTSKSASGVAPNAPPPSYDTAVKEIAVEKKKGDEIESVRSDNPNPDPAIYKADQIAKGDKISGGAKADCSKEPEDFSHAAAKVDMSQDGSLESMIKTVIILPGFFQGNIPYPNVGKEMNGETISISSIIGIVLLCSKSGKMRQLPLYRHTFVSTVPLGPRSQNHVFSLFPLLQTDSFLKNATTIEECFGQRPQNTQQYMYSKAHIRAVITQTFPDNTFPWFGFDNKDQKIVTNNPAITDLVTKSNEIFAELRSAARDMKLSGDCQLPTTTGKPEEITGVYNKIDKKGLLPPWMKAGSSNNPPMLATGWGTPVKPSAATVEAFMCKGNLQGFLNTQENVTRGLIGGDNWINIQPQNLTGPVSASASLESIPVIKNAIKEYISAYRNSFGSDVIITQSGGDYSDTVNIDSKSPRHAIVTKSGFIGNTQVQDKLGDEAIKWLNEINQKMITYNKKGTGQIIDRQYLLEDIQMKTQILALILAAVTGMAPTVIPKVSRENIPGDPNLKNPSGGANKRRLTNKKLPKRRSKTYKKKT